MCPNQEEITIYKEWIGDKHPVCLLGMTSELVSLCDMAADLNPIEIGKPTIKCDWNELNGQYGTVIGDGVINLEGLPLVEKILKISDRFITRVFTRKFPWMKYATIFPCDFPGSKEIVTTQENIVMVYYQSS